MKKIAILLLFSLGMFITSCEESKKEKTGNENKEELHDHSDDLATAEYQCPMKCEDEKTYSEPGNCPECKMALKEVKE